MDINIAGDLGYRPMVVHDEGYCLFLVLLGKATACRTHSLVSRLIRATNPCVHQSGNGPRQQPYRDPVLKTAFVPHNLLSLSLIHISEPTRQAEISYAVFCLKKKKKNIH